jgi:hypothetical protein
VIRFVAAYSGKQNWASSRNMSDEVLPSLTTSPDEFDCTQLISSAFIDCAQLICFGPSRKRRTSGELPKTWLPMKAGAVR